MPDNRGDPMSILDRDFIKDRYDFELARKESLTGALALPVGILSGLGSVLAYMARGFKYRDPVLTWIFGIGLVFAGAAFLSCLSFLGRAYLAQTYVYLPLPEGAGRLPKPIPRIRKGDGRRRRRGHGRFSRRNSSGV